MEGLAWSELVWFKIRASFGDCENSKNISGSLKSQNLLPSLDTITFSRNPAVSS